MAAGVLWLHVWLAALAIALPLLVGGRAIVISGDSMEPTLGRGDVVVAAAPPSSGALRRGSVVTFREGPLLVTHRVVQTNRDGTITTQGDANPDADSTDVQRRSVVGVARMVVPDIARPRQWAADGRWVAFGGWLALLALTPLGLNRRRMERAIARFANRYAA